VFDTDDADASDAEFAELFLHTYEDPPPELSEAFDSGDIVMSAEPYTDEYGTFVSAFLPIKGGDGEVEGVLGLDYDITHVQGLEREALIVFLVSLLGAALIAGFLSFIVSSSLIKPIKEVTAASKSLASMDFNIKTSKTRKDEIGDLQKALYTIRDNLRKTMGQINNEQLGKQLNISRNLNGIIRKSSDDLDAITREVDQVRQKTDREVGSVEETYSALEEIFNNINTLNSAVETQSASIGESSQTIEKMVADIEKIRQVARDAVETTVTLGKSSETGKRVMDKLSGELERLSGQSRKLMEANKTISAITARTNILAMNATIEAAHAGEAGKGFAVVAGEVRQLAESSSKETSRISAEVKNMENDLNEMRRVSAETVEMMSGMFEKIDRVEKSFDAITREIEAEAASGVKVLEALKTIRDSSEELRNGSAVIQKGSDLIRQTFADLQSGSREVNENVATVQNVEKQIVGSLGLANRIAVGKILVKPGTVNEGFPVEAA
jgi:methyl-accepting chemotaxis protein